MQKERKRNAAGCGRKKTTPTSIFTKSKGGVPKSNSRCIVGPVDDHLGQRHVAHTGVIWGVRQHQLELLRELVLAVVDELNVAGGHADAGPKDDAVVVGHAAALVIRAGLQSVEAAALSRLGHGVAECRHGAGGVTWEETGGRVTAGHTSATVLLLQLANTALLLTHNF